MGAGPALDWAGAIRCRLPQPVAVRTLDSFIVRLNDQLAEPKKIRFRGGYDGHKAGSSLALGVPAAAGAIRAGAVGAVLQLRRAELDRAALLLLVSAGSGLHLRRRDGHRLFHHRIVAAAVIESPGNTMQDINWVALIVFLVLFGFITWLGFAAAHWRRGDMDQLHEWGLGGLRFGTLIVWFLVGGDLYTAHPFIAALGRGL